MKTPPIRLPILASFAVFNTVLGFLLRTIERKWKRFDDVCLGYNM